MPGWGAGRTGTRRLVATGIVAVALLGSGIVSSPVTAAPGDDCGGGDTPPARHLASGERCDGSLAEPATTSTPRPQGYIEHRYEDAYTFSHTDGDLVRIESTLPACTVTEPAEGSFVADGDATSPLAVIGRRTAAEDGSPAGPCPNQPDGYWVRVTVTPNDRPSVAPGAVDTSGQPGDTYTFEVSGTDPNGDLSALGVRFGDSDNYDWKTQLLASGSWSTSFRYQFYSDITLRFYARDSKGALSIPSAPFFVDVGQNDCGLGRDAEVESVTLPVHCNNNWLDGASDTDSFTFTPPPGRRPKATVTVAPLQGYVATLTSPSGVATSTSSESDPDLYGTDEAGVWRVDVRGDGDIMGYQLDITDVGPLAPPTLTVSAPPIAHQGDYYAFTMTGTDPNGETLSYEVDWGNGSKAIWPIYGRAASGDTVTGYRRFIEPTPTSWTATVTATNSEGLTATATFTVTVELHDDCGLGDPVYDAPGGTSQLVVMPPICDGTVGFYLPVYYDDVDTTDVYRSPVSCLATERCKVRVTMTTEPGLAATVTIDDTLLKQSASCTANGCTTTVSSLGPSSPNARISIRSDSGKGGYRLVVEKVALTAGVI